MKFYTKPAIRYFARPGLLIMILSLCFFSLCLDVIFVYDTIVSIYCGSDIAKNIVFLASIIGLNFLSAFEIFIYIKGLHEKCFATLEVYDTKVVWKCIFKKSHTIMISDCKFIGVESEESFNGLDYPFIYFAIHYYPNEFSRKINKIRVTDEFIKFWYTDELAEYVILHLPKEKTGGVQYYQHQKKARRRK